MIHVKLQHEHSRTLPSDDPQHCWHYALSQHTMQNHRDDVCCRCGRKRCVTLAPLTPPGDHGPFATSKKKASLSESVRTTHDGRRFVDANVLIRTWQAKQHLKNIANVRTSEKKAAKT